ncbi:MAG: hypothetical protein IPK26_20155 [Planctomycetes bacterium]|nr:hypothetical protein [Planctomycetota bacterium]
MAETPGFTFAFPGGTTTQFSCSTNGFVWLGANTAPDLTPTPSGFLQQMARVCMAWRDLHAGRNVTTHPASGLYVQTDSSGGVGNGVTHVTWLEVGEFAVAASGVSVNTMQCALFENGQIEMRYGQINGMQGAVVISGFSRGGSTTVPAIDGGSRDLSHEVPFTTTPEGTGAGITLAPDIRPILGAGSAFSLTHTMNALPVGTLLAAVLIDFQAITPGVPLPFGASGCLQSIAVPNILATAVAPASTWTSGGTTLPLGLAPDAGGWMDAVAWTQGIVLSLDPSGNPSTRSTNANKLVFGLR